MFIPTFTMNNNEMKKKKKKGKGDCTIRLVDVSINNCIIASNQTQPE